MTVLLLRLAGPLQAWGDSSRFARRDTGRYPTKSGVLGLLAAAEGRRRTDEIEDLTRLRFGIRVDQPGQLQRDFQTAINWSTGKSMPLSYRYYLADAVFVACVEGDRGLLEALDTALMDPVFPLYLGRRSCPTSGRVSLGVVDEDLTSALSSVEWQAASWYRRIQPQRVELELVVDAVQGSADPTETRRDVPLSFSPERREYGWREVAHLPPAIVGNPLGRPSRPATGIDWLDAVEEA
ncbi:MAG: type I-E CRISPR-associated protein Cas5/CasD [Micropruina sp.]